MSHANGNEPDQVNTGVLAVVLALVTLAVLGIAMFVTSLVRQESEAAESVRAENQDQGTRDLRNAQISELAKGPEFSDRGKGLVQVPIDRAMALVLASVRENPYALSPGVKPEAEEGMGGAGSGDEPEPLKAGEKSADEPKPADAKPADVKLEKKPADAPKAPVAPVPAEKKPAPAAPEQGAPASP